MVSEETLTVCNKICDNNNNNCDKIWLSKNNNNNEKNIYNDDNNITSFIHQLIVDMCDSAINFKEQQQQMNQVVMRKKNINRKTCVFENDFFTLDENDNKLIEAINPKLVTDIIKKPKKRLSFNSFFGKKNRNKIHENSEDYDHFDPQIPLSKSKKYTSAMELNQKIQRTPSFFKKIVNFGEESKGLLKRSMSFRDLNKKRDKTKGKLNEAKKQEWRQSLQSLVENDISVSYNDLSFVDYDVLNDINYNCTDWTTNSIITRTQSMIVKRSPEFRRPSFNRGTSTASENFHSNNNTNNFSEQSGALSLPSLHHLNQENAENTSPTNTHRYRRRPQSTSSEDGSVRSRRLQEVSGSFRSAGGGCAKLKRHNACRQKVRNTSTISYFEVGSVERNNSTNQSDIDLSNNNNSVRSRSLNHLDTLEMRQGVVSTNDPALKDSISEPNCTKPLLAPPIPQLGQDTLTPTGDYSVASSSSSTSSRKHMLSRSQKSSSECFSVNFEVGDETIWDNELFFPAQRGITLHDSLTKLCEIRNIDLSLCEARLVDKEGNAETFISFNQDTASLVSRHIRITAKELTKKLSGSVTGNHSRKPSGGYRPRTSSFFSSSTEEPATASSTLSLHEGDQNKKQIKQRLTAFFGNTKDTKYEALIDQLDKYSKLGIPNNINYPLGQCESIDALYKLEEDWRNIINYHDLHERQQQQQTALWELIKSEVSYIKTLKVVTDLFLACLKDLQSHNLLKEIDTEKLFSNITEILDANVIFWRNTLFPLVRDMRKHHQTSCIENMLEGFSTIHETFQPYYKYCAEQARCQHYCRENLDSDVFAAYLTWCESQKECNRLRLMDILVQPMQRLTKYGLLLKAILKNTDEDVERENLQSMIKMVDDFVINVNASLKHKQDKERLKGIIARIESYDIVESKDDDIEKILKKDRSLSSLDLTRPMINCPSERKRHLLLEGDLKLKDSGTSKMEVHCFLLTDMLLICKPSTKKGGSTMRVVRQPYLVDRLLVTELHRETPSLAIIYKNEFDMAIAAFILQNNDAKKLKGWKEGIVKAQSLYAQAKQMTFMTDESLDAADYTLDYNLESDYHNLQIAPRSPLPTSSRASRVSSLAHSHSGSVEMNDQSSVGSAKDQSRAVSVDNENRTGSLSSDEGVQTLPADSTSKSPVSQKNSFKNRLFSKTPNTLSVQPYGHLGQSLPNLTLGSPSIGNFSLSLNPNNTLSVPSGKNTSAHILSPTTRGISYPPPSPTRGNLRRGLAISQTKNPPLIKTRHINSTTSTSITQIPASFDFDVPVIAGVSSREDQYENFCRGQHRQAMKRIYRNDKRYHTAGVVDDIKKNDNRDNSIHKRLSWNCNSSQDQKMSSNEDHT